MKEHFENLKIGDFVTVLNGKKYDIEEGGYFSEKGIIVTQKAREDGSYKGDVLEIIAMQYPYVILKNHSNKNHRINLDLREWSLMKLNQDYVNVYLTKENKCPQG